MLNITSNYLADSVSPILMSTAFSQMKGSQLLMLLLQNKKNLHVMLADDDADDCEFFDEAIHVINDKIKLTIACPDL